MAEPSRADHRLEGSIQGENIVELIQWLTVAVFAVTILFVVINKVDSTAAALIGVTVMIWIGHDDRDRSVPAG